MPVISSVTVRASAVFALVLSVVPISSADVTQIWAERYFAPNQGDSWSPSLVVDAQGNVYVLGYGDGAGTGHDYITVKYTSDGEVAWVARYDGADHGNDLATAIALDPTGGVCVTGFSYAQSSHFDLTTIAYDAEGVKRWAAVYNGEENRYDYGHAIAVDEAGNVYVAGAVGGGSGPSDCITIKYNHAGERQWVARHDHWAGRPDGLFAIALGPAGSVYVAGVTCSPTSVDDYLTIKYDAEGEEQWAITYDGPAHCQENLTDLAVDAAGNAYITGWSPSIPYDDEGLDYATIKYGPTGEPKWVARYDGPRNDRDEAMALALDPLGNVYVTGLSVGFDCNSEFATIKYNASGEEEWVARFAGAGGDCAGGRGVVVDAAGGICVTGFSANPSTSLDYATIRYTSDGAMDWTIYYDGPSHDMDEPWDIAAGPSGSIYVTGTGWESSDVGLATVKYGMTQGTGERRTADRLWLHCGTVKPGSVEIRFSLPEARSINLRAYDVSGALRQTILAGPCPAGIHHAVWRDVPGSGVYFLKLDACEGLQTTAKVMALR